MRRLAFPGATPLRHAARWCAAVFAISWAAGGPVHAMPGVDEPPLPQPARPVVVPEFQEERLPNGVRVVVARRAELPLVTVLLQFRGGAAADPPGRTGLAGLTATLLSKGSVRQGRPVDATQIARQAEALGSTLSTGADWQGTLAAMTVNTAKLPAAVALIADVVRRPLLAQAELDRARDQLVDGLKLSLSDPGALSAMVARRAYWGTSAYGAITTPATLARITRADVAGFHARFVRPELSTVIYTGDITLEQAVKLTRAHLGDWRGSRLAPAADAPPGPSRRAPRTVIVNLPGAGQTSVVVTAPFVGAGDADRRTGQVAAAVLGGGYSARLNQEVRIKRGLAYGASAGTESHPAAGGRNPGGMLSASTQTNHPNAVQVAELVRAEILRLGREAPGSDELAARQATLIGSFARRLESTEGLARLIADQLAGGRELEALRDLPQEVLAVSADAVREFAQRWFTDATLRTVIVSDLQQAGPALQALDERSLQVDAAELDFEGAGLR